MFAEPGAVEDEPSSTVSEMSDLEVQQNPAGKVKETSLSTGLSGLTRAFSAELDSSNTTNFDL